MANNCTSPSPSCPVSMTVYGYYPSLPANAFFAAWFFAFTIPIAILAFRSRVWVYSAFVFAATLFEALGYVGRIMMHSNPWNSPAFELQICTLIFAPSFYAGAVYMTLKHIARTVHPDLSPLKPVLYPAIFMSADFLSLSLQAIGGGIAASANDNAGSLEGANIMLSGIVFQVFTLTVVFILAAIFCARVSRHTTSIAPEAKAIVSSRSFQIFMLGIGTASLAIYVRCIYRIAELAGGWANSVMRSQTGFIAADGVMCVIAVSALTICHPGIFFKESTMVPKRRDHDDKEKTGHSGRVGAISSSSLDLDEVKA